MDRSPWTRLRFDDGLLALLAAAIVTLAIASLVQLVQMRQRSTMETNVVQLPAAPPPSP